MSLFVRLEVSFWTHRKTLRLRALLGESAFWIPPRLWSYAAQNQPDGDFSDYLPEEIGMLLGFSGDAKSMLEALQQAGFMDSMKLHGWSERNSYHEVFAERAKKAAKARWSKEKKGAEKIREEPRNASSMPSDAIRSLHETYCARTAYDLMLTPQRVSHWQEFERRGWGNEELHRVIHFIQKALSSGECQFNQQSLTFGVLIEKPDKFEERLLMAKNGTGKVTASKMPTPEEAMGL